MNTYDESHYTIKGFIKYVSTVISWTIFVILSLIAIFLLYYYVSVKLYAGYGDKFEPLFSVYTIITESMDPTISRYDVIVNTKIDKASDVKINDVITFISTGSTTYGMTITHRVIGTKTTDTGETCFVTRGDNNTEQDAACVTPNNVIGIVRAVVPKLGYIQSILSSGYGWFLLVLVPAIYVICKDIMKLFKVNKNDNLDSKKIDKNKNEKTNSKKKIETVLESKIEDKKQVNDSDKKEEKDEEFEMDFDEVENNFKLASDDETNNFDEIKEDKILKNK